MAKEKVIAENGKQLDPKVVERVTKQMQIEADVQRREMQCAKKIEEILKEFQCGIFAFNTVDPQSGVAIPKATMRALPPTE